MKMPLQFITLPLFAVVLSLAVGCTPGEPLAGFTADPTNGPAPLTVEFTDASRIAKQSAITAWSWDFGDGGASTGQNPSHIYSIPGTYTVSLTVTSDTGKTNTATLADYIVVDAEGEETILLPGGVPLKMVWIPGETFLMGRNSDEQDSWSDEEPRHSVTISGFWMGKHELTKRQWEAVMGTTPWSGTGYVLNHLDSPAVQVSWGDAQAFIAALNSHTAQAFRLPSEAEWEHACRAGTTTRFYWGNDPDYTQLGSHAWWNGNAWIANEAYAHVVGQTLPNAWGLHDMSGNVWEWCQDWYNTSYTGAPTDGSAWVSPTGTDRVVRGGSWYGFNYDCRSAYRAHYAPSHMSTFIGFRLAR